MPLLPLRDLLQDARRHGYAVPHFNIANFEVAVSVTEAAAALDAPVVFGVHPVESDYFGQRPMVAMLRALVDEHGATACIHLDHGPDLAATVRAIRAGYNSVMFDGSLLPIEENVRVTSNVVDIARAAGVSVEGEVGTIGNTTEYGEEIHNAHLADPAAAQALAETGIDALAVAIGNAHGVYIAEPQLDFDLLAEIGRRTDVPLVLHGGTGIPHDQVRKAIGMGICKMNIGTAIHLGYRDAVSAFMAAEPGCHDIMKIAGAGRAAVKQVVLDHMELVMAPGRATALRLRA